MRALGPALLFAIAALPAAAQEAVVTSPVPSAVALTVYRDPDGQPPFNLDWLGGFALVTETRVVRLPAGPATIRFEGVAGGIVPASALVTGLPDGVVEKNRDGRLLSPAALAAGWLGRRVMLTRTDRASGTIRVQPAVLVAGPAGGLVVRTPDGVEALGCSGLADKPSYAGVPADLTAGPMLSVRTVSRAAATATVTLSYLTSAFDWAASYVATLRPDGRHLDLFAWATLANGNRERFPAAQVQVIAGRVNQDSRPARESVPALRLDCYPLGTTTSTLPPPEVADDSGGEDIVVTAQRVSMAMAAPVAVATIAAEDLGDLKLYRVPQRVTVAASQQKQVVLLQRRNVPYDRVFRLTLPTGQNVPLAPTNVALLMRNTAVAGLGLPLPAGGTALYGARSAERLLLGVGEMRDIAIGENLRVGAGTSTQVLVSQTRLADGRLRIDASNANPFPVAIEIALQAPPDNVEPIHGIAVVEDRPTWVATLPANGRASLIWRLKPDRG